MMEKTYILVNARLESKEIVSLELLDESSQPSTVRTAVFRLAKEDYEALGKPSVGEKFSIKVEVAKAQ